MDGSISGGTLNDLLTFKGDEHLRELLVPRTEASLSAEQLALLNSAPPVYVNTNASDTGNANRREWPSILQLSDNQLPAGDLPFEYVTSEVSEIAFQVGPADPRNTTGANEIWANVDVVDSVGDPLQDSVQARGVHELGVHASERDIDPESNTDRLLYLDSNGNQTTSDTGIFMA